MTDSNAISFVRSKRAAAGLSQAELAERVGVSRQTLSAVEAGRQVPSTTLALQLARALRCTVDELFRLPGGPVLKAKLVAQAGEKDLEKPGRVALGRVDGRLIAHPLFEVSRPADGVISEVGDAGEALVELLGDAAEVENTLLIAGCAPLLGLLSERLGRRYRDAQATWIHADSGRALELLKNGLVHIAGVHLASEADPDAHARAARAAFPGQSVTVVNLARWRQGLVLARGNPHGIEAGSDLLRANIRRALRAPGSGAQRVFERISDGVASAPVSASADLAQIEPATLDPLASGHAEVARLIRWGIADVGVAIESAALAENLDFIPVSEERFDLIIPDSRLGIPGVARFLDLIDQQVFRNEAGQLPGYDLSIAGHASSVAADL